DLTERVGAENVKAAVRVGHHADLPGSVAGVVAGPIAPVDSGREVARLALRVPVGEMEQHGVRDAIPFGGDVRQVQGAGRQRVVDIEGRAVAGGGAAVVGDGNAERAVAHVFGVEVTAHDVETARGVGDDCDRANAVWRVAGAVAPVDGGREIGGRRRRI